MSASKATAMGIKGFLSDFESSPEGLKARLRKCQEIHQRFLSRFPRGKLEEILTLKKYVIGRGDTDTFCYWVERGTRPLGSILGARADKFKVYFSRKEQRYKWVKGSTTAQAAFRKTKSEILNLLNAGENDDLQAIKTNHFFRNSHLYRGKLLYLYFPNKFLNVFAEDDIDHFLNRLGIECEENEHVLDKQMKLLEYRNNTVSMRSWSNLKFGLFLYDQFEPPSRTISKSFSQKKVAQTTKDLLGEEGAYVLPRPKEVDLRTIDLADVTRLSRISAKARGRRRQSNFLLENIRKQKLGDQAEEIVLLYEKQALAECNRRNLMEKVKRVSLKDDSLGYDILSYTAKGRAKYIEVKATKSGVDAHTPFYLTETQRQVMESKRGQYFIYRVYSANTKNPRLLVIDYDLAHSHLEMRSKLWEVSIK